MRPFKLALAQMRVVAGQPALNLRTAVDYIRRAAEAGADLVLLPEALDCGWCDESSLPHAGAIPGGVSCKTLRAAACEHHIRVCAGIVERADDEFFNSAVLIAPDGRILLHHRKLNELAMAHLLYSAGDRLGVARTELGVIGLMICADGFAPGQSVGRALCLMGAQIILSPCAWAVPPEHDNTRDPYGRLWIEHYGAVASDGRVWIVGASNVGPITSGEWAGHHCIGCSLVVKPGGETALRGSYGVDAEELLLVDVQLEDPPRGDGRT